MIGSTIGGVLSSAAIEIEQLGLGERLVDYHQGWDYQRELHAKVSTGELPGRVLLLEHEAVYTAGRQTLPEERPFDGTPVVDVDRGGKITWHGPGQLVGYPIIRLPSRIGVVDHVRRMEQAVIDLLAELGIDGERVEGRTGVWLASEGTRPVTVTAEGIWDSDTRPANSDQADSSRGPDHSGSTGSTGSTGQADSTNSSDVRPDARTAPAVPTVPTALQNIIALPARPERKICAIGIRVSRRTTMHGFAINVTNTTAAFENIIPCGISDAGVTSIADELGSAPSMPDLARMLEPHLVRCLDYERTLTDVLAGV